MTSLLPIGTIPHRDRICYYLDENVDQHIVMRLRENGITVILAADVGLLGEKDDAVHLAESTELGCVLVTNDEDFGAIDKEINRRWTQGQEAYHAGIVFISRPRSPGELIRKLVSIYQTKRPKDLVNRFWSI